VRVLCLSFPYHVNHFNARQDSCCVGDRFEAQHGPDPALDSTVVLFNPVIEVLALPDADRLQWPLRLVSKTALAIAGNDCFPVRLATVNDDAICGKTGRMVL
jgi:hypothetical protein